MIGQGIFQHIADHSIFAVLHFVGQEIINYAESVLAIVIIGIDDANGASRLRQASNAGVVPQGFSRPSGTVIPAGTSARS